jgi:hypothetical protein
MITFNYYCLNSKCIQNKLIQINKIIEQEDNPEYCIKCMEELKQVGRATNISHIGTQESNNIKY